MIPVLGVFSALNFLYFFCTLVNFGTFLYFFFRLVTIQFCVIFQNLTFCTFCAFDHFCTFLYFSLLFVPFVILCTYCLLSTAYWAEFCYVWLELDWSECPRQPGMWTSPHGESCYSNTLKNEFSSLVFRMLWAISKCGDRFLFF